MKVAIITGRDTTNFTMAHLAKHLIDRGHKIDIYLMYDEEIHNYMFTGLEVNRYSFMELTKERIEKYDIAYVNPNFFSDIFSDKMHHELLSAEVYYFSFNCEYLDEPICGTDFVFERGVMWKEKLKYTKRPDTTYMVVGDPKHDLIDVTDIKEKKNRILFIDSGHFPFGRDSKLELARFLLDVCKKFPRNELVIKPRFLPNDTNVTHKNNYHLYDALNEVTNGKLPDNLVLYYEHRDLNIEIAKAHTVICMYTTAYIDVAVQKKGLIILEDLPCEDNAELRIKTHWDVANKIMQPSGCVISYHKAINYLPDGIICNEEHLKEHLYSIGNISGKMTCVIENIWENLICNKICLKSGVYYYDKDYLAQIQDEQINMKDIVARRKKNYIYYLERMFLKNTCIEPSDSISHQKIVKLCENHSLNKYSFEEIRIIVDQILLDMVNDLPKDRISQEYYLNNLLTTCNFNFLNKLNEKDILCRKFYFYIKGRAYYYDKNYVKALECFKCFIDIEEEEYSKSLGDKNNYIVSNYFYSALSCVNLGKYEEARNYFEKCQELTDGNHRKATEELEKLQILCLSNIENK